MISPNKTARLVILASIIAILAIALVFTFLSNEKQPPIEEIHSPDLGRVVTVTIWNIYGRFQFKSQGDDWIDSSDNPILLNQTMIRQLLQLYYSAEMFRTLPDENLSIGEVGLDDAVAKITFERGQDVPVQVVIGLQNPSKTEFYAQYSLENVADASIKMIPSALVQMVLVPKNAYREYSLPTVKVDDIKKISVAGKHNFVITKVHKTNHEDGELLSIPFVITTPNTKRPLDEIKFSEFLTSIPPVLQIRKYIEEDVHAEKKYGLDEPQSTITLETEIRTFTLSLGDYYQEDLLYAISNQIEDVFVLDKADLSFLQTSANDLLSKFIYLLDISFLDSFTFKAPKKEITGRIARERSSEEYILNDISVDEEVFKSIFKEFISMQMKPIDTTPNVEVKMSKFRLHYFLTDGSNIAIEVFSDAEDMLYVHATTQDKEWWGTISSEIVDSFLEALSNM